MPIISADSSFIIIDCYSSIFSDECLADGLIINLKLQLNDKVVKKILRILSLCSPRQLYNSLSAGISFT